MSSSGKPIFVGIGWAVIVTVVLLLVDPSSRSLAVIVAMLILSAGFVYIGSRYPSSNGQAKDKAFKPFLGNLQQLLEPLLPSYANEGKSYLTIALGCTGGKHRSVFVAEKMGEWLQQKNIAVTIEHRDINRF